MSRENMVISMDGHTECFLNLKPWLASHLHGAFDAATDVGRHTFAGGSRYWADLVYAGTEFAWESANKLEKIDETTYHQVMTCEQRRTAIQPRWLRALRRARKLSCRRFVWPMRTAFAAFTCRQRRRSPRPACRTTTMRAMSRSGALSTSARWPPYGTLRSVAKSRNGAGTAPSAAGNRY